MVTSWPIHPNRRAILAVAPALLLDACHPKAGSSRVRIGYQRDGVLLLAQSEGRLETELKAVGVTGVEWILFPSGPPLLEAMRAGAVDFGATGETPPIFAQAGDAPLVYAAAEPVTGAGQALLIPRGSTVRSIAELKGRTLGFTPGSTSHLFALQALKGAGLTLNDVHQVPLSPPDGAAAFAKGALDGWIVWDSYFALAERDLSARPILTANQLPGTSSFYLASKAFADGSPKVLSALLTSLSQSAQRGNARPDLAIRTIARASGLSEDIVRISRRRGPFAVAPLTDALIARQQVAADTFSEAGVIPKRIRVNDAAWRGWMVAA
jgi:sulfonate transport system substrate-binding protein